MTGVQTCALPILTTEDSYYIEGIAKVEDRLLILLDLDRALGAAVRRAGLADADTDAESVAA